MSYLGKFSEIDFYASSLRPFIEKKYIKYDKSAEDQVINLIFAYFARRIQTYKRISNLRKFNWIRDEPFEVFAGRAISIIKTANIRSFSEAQLQIMGLVDMITNQVLKKKCQEKLDELLKMTLTEALEKVRTWDSKLSGLANTRYSRRGEKVIINIPKTSDIAKAQNIPASIPAGQSYKNGTQQPPKNAPVNLLATRCFTCGGENHMSRECKIVVDSCTSCKSDRHNTAGHLVREEFLKKRSKFPN